MPKSHAAIVTVIAAKTPAMRSRRRRHRTAPQIRMFATAASSGTSQS
jgi:hypothetical protein